MEGQRCMCVYEREGGYLSFRMKPSYIVQLPRKPGSFSLLRDWSLITGRGGLQNGKIAGPKPFVPPPSRQGKTYKDWKLYTAPLQYG